MADEIQDVNTESSPVENQEVVETQAESTSQPEEGQQTQDVQQQQTQSSPAASKPAVEALDEFGVPYKNRFAEYRRKYEDLEQKLNQIQQQGSQTTPQYTEEQLRAFSAQNPAYAPWANTEIDKLKEQKIAKAIRSEMESWKQEQVNEQKRQQAFSYVASNFPDVFVKDQNGKPVLGQWDLNNPVVREIGNLMQDPRVAKEADGLAIAADIAFSRVMRQQAPIIQQKIQQQKTEVKNLQKRTLVEGGGQTSGVAKPAHRVALDNLAQTGSMKDALSAMKEINKLRGTIEE